MENENELNKNIIINIDDVGLLNSINIATIMLLKTTPISSVSVMPPAPWTPGFLCEIKNNKINVDIGIHLCLTSEWSAIRIRPILGLEVPSLLDEEGYFHSNLEHLYQFYNAEEVKRELEAQITFINKWGIKPSHLDAHMVFYEKRTDLLDILIALGKEYNIPILLHDLKSIRRCLSQKVICPTYGNLSNYYFSIGKRRVNYKSFLAKFPTKGIGVLALHPGLLCMEMEATMGEYALKREEEYQIFMDRKFLNDLRIIVSTPRALF